MKTFIKAETLVKSRTLKLGNDRTQEFIDRMNNIIKHQKSTIDIFQLAIDKDKINDGEFYFLKNLAEKSGWELFRHDWVIHPNDYFEYTLMRKQDEK